MKWKKALNINIPTPLRAYTGGQQTVNVPGATVGEALEQLVGAYPDLRQHLYTGEGKLRSFVNLYLNDDDIRYLPQKEAAGHGLERRALHHSFHRGRSCPYW